MFTPIVRGSVAGCQSRGTELLYSSWSACRFSSNNKPGHLHSICKRVSNLRTPPGNSFRIYGPLY